MAFSEGLHYHGRLQPHLGSECKKRKPTMISVNEAVQVDEQIKIGPSVVDNDQAAKADDSAKTAANPLLNPCADLCLQS